MREALPKCWQGKETPKDLYLFKSCHGIKSYFLIQQLEKQMIGCQQIISFILHVIGWVMLGPLGWVGCRRGKTRHFSKGLPRWGRDTQLDHPSALPECLQLEGCMFDMSGLQCLDNVLIYEIYFWPNLCEERGLGMRGRGSNPGVCQTPWIIIHRLSK